MASPFSTLEEFNGAIDGPTGGAIYTFADKPAINNIALIVAAGLFIWFIVKTYSGNHDIPVVDKTLNRLSSFIVAGLLSIMAADHIQQTHQSERSPEMASQSRLYQSSRRAATPGLLGMAGMVLPTFRQGSQRRKRSRRKSSFRARR